jgi:hypothetical protein
MVLLWQLRRKLYLELRLLCKMHYGGDADHQAKVTSVVKIDDMIALAYKTGHRSTLERTMGQKASDKWKR